MIIECQNSETLFIFRISKQFRSRKNKHLCNFLTTFPGLPFTKPITSCLLYEQKHLTQSLAILYKIWRINFFYYKYFYSVCLINIFFVVKAFVENSFENQTFCHVL